MKTFKMPVAFMSDFGPMPAIENDDYTMALERVGRDLPRPRAVVVMSGHWAAGETLSVTSALKPEMIYDFYGFPEKFYQVRYRCQGDPETAAEVVRLLTAAGFSANTDPDRGIDHGAWVPLSRVYPRADIPIVQLTVPAGEDPRKIMAIGRALKPLREKRILLVGSGTLVHNLRLVRFGSLKADEWAEAFDRWVGTRLDNGSIDEIVHYKTLAPSANLAVPTSEHFDPLFFVLGAAGREEPVHFFRAIRHGSGSLRIIGFGMRNENDEPESNINH
ncbi:MAG: dioxygenase [Nitrospirae bacterium]|nr:dioxygenase [Nitrospirota bacterium]